MTVKRQFFIFGYYGWKNAGDDAMLYALLQELHALEPKAKFAVLSAVPVTIPPQTEGKTKFVKLSPLAVSREILRSSTLIIGGGTHLFDHGNKIRALKMQLRILLLVLYSKVLRKKVYLLHNGLGPISTVWGKFLCRSIYHLADYISVRDEASYRILKAWGSPHKTSLAFDLSALIEGCDEPGTDIQKNERILGISVTPVFRDYYHSQEKDFLLINKIAEQITDRLKREPQLQVYLFTFKGPSKDDDVFVTKLLQELLEPPERVKLVPYDPDPGKMLARVAQCHTFIGMRYHACLFAYLSHVPLLAIDYHPKCRALAEEIGLPQHAVISLEEILAGQFGEYLKNLLESPESFLAALPVDVARQRAKSGLSSVG